MDGNTVGSNVKLASNIMLKSKYERDQWAYIPADLLPAYYSDCRAAQFLSPSQRQQMEKKLYYATEIIDE